MKYFIEILFFINSEESPQKKIAIQKPKVTAKSLKKRISNLKFPIDFFEKCKETADVEFTGTDILHVYNKTQVKHRLNTAGMYIANTKVRLSQLDQI